MLHPAANSHPKATHQWLLMGRLNNPLACFILQPTGTPRPHINSLRRPRLPFASIYTIQTIPQSQINSFFSAFQLAVYHLSLSQRRPWQKTASHRPFDGLLALSSRHWPHSLCKRGKCKHTVSPSQRRPSQKTGSHRPFDGLFALSWHHWPHSLCKRGKCTHTLFPHNAVLYRKLVPTDRSMIYFPCLDVTGHIPFASGANVNIRFFLHNAVLDWKLVPTDRSMVYFPCLDVTGHIPFASGANVNIRFFLHNAVLDRKLLPTDRSMVYLPCLEWLYFFLHPWKGVGGTRVLAHSIYEQWILSHNYYPNWLNYNNHG